MSLRILDLLQRDCKLALAAIGHEVGLSAPSVVERVRKLERQGLIQAYVARLDARRLGRHVVAFIGVSVRPAADDKVDRAIARLVDVLEVHHVTGPYSLMVKVLTESTESLEEVLRQVLAIPGVTNTETMVVLRTHTERWTVPIDVAGAPRPRRRRQPAATARGR